MNAISWKGKCSKVVGFLTSRIFTNKKLLALAIIICIGIFLRTYNFSDWLRFNPDQSRDAQLISNVVSEKEDWPLLGPKAGGTNYRLGPFFYYMGIISAMIFGSSPDKMAYPDLIFAILSIPLFYLLLRKYFGSEVTLLLTALYTFSFFTVKYSRFAWNPNSLPFFSMLLAYSLLEIGENKNRNKLLYPILAGISLGAGIQLHSIFLFVMPTVVLVFFLRLHQQKSDFPVLKTMSIIISLAVLLNTPQLIYEIKNKGNNTYNFSQAILKKSATTTSFGQKIAFNVACHLQANSFILSSMGDDSDCEFSTLPGKITFKMKKTNSLFGWFPMIKIKNEYYGLLLRFVIASLFSLFTYFLLIKNALQEKVASRKTFLLLVSLLSGMCFLLFIPLSQEVSLRFFLFIPFVPFVLLGLLFQYIKSKYKNSRWIIYAISIFLALSSLLRINSEFGAYAMNDGLSAHNIDFVMLSEAQNISDIIISDTPAGAQAVIMGSKSDLFMLMKPVSYLSGKYGSSIVEFSKKSTYPGNSVYYFIGHRKHPESKNRPPKEIENLYDISKAQFAGRFVIYKMTAKNFFNN